MIVINYISQTIYLDLLGKYNLSDLNKMNI